jgi:hypothetical protein
MLRKIHGINFFHIKFLGPTNIKYQNGPDQVFYLNGQALTQNSKTGKKFFCHILFRSIFQFIIF